MSDEVARTAAKFAARHVAPRAADADHGEPAFPPEVFARGIEAGFDRLVLPEEAGGSGFATADLCALVTALAETCAGHAMVFGVHAASLRALWDAGAGDAVTRVLASGRPLAVAVPEPTPTGDFFASLAFEREGDGGARLTGSAGLAINVGSPGWRLVFARDGQGRAAALLLESPDGAVLEPALGLRAMPIAELNADGRVVAAGDVVAEGGAATALYRSLLRHVSLVAAAAAVGTAGAAHKKALDYAAQRYQGGRMIVDHSHLREILGRMSGNISAARGAVLHAASPEAADTAVLGTKASVTEAAVAACTDAVQALGGYGYMRDYGLEKRMRDAAVLALLPVSNPRAALLVAAWEKG